MKHRVAIKADAADGLVTGNDPVRAIADLLITMGCEEGQGYFFGKPMPPREFEAQFMVAHETAAAAG